MSEKKLQYFNCYYFKKDAYKYYGVTRSNILAILGKTNEKSVDKIRKAEKTVKGRSRTKNKFPNFMGRGRRTVYTMMRKERKLHSLYLLLHIMLVYSQIDYLK